MNNRLAQLRFLLYAHKSEALFVTNLYDIRWAVGFSGSNGVLLVTPDEATFLTDSRYTEQAREEVQEANVRIMDKGMWRYLAAEKMLPEGRVVFQSDHLKVADLERLRKLLPTVRWHGESGLLEKLVAVKNDDEIETITRALRISEQAFEEVVPLMQPGVTELDLAAEITYRQLRAGAEKIPEGFSPIVASGVQSSRPHASASPKKLEQGEMVLLDFGCVVGGYVSDMSRTVALGEPGPVARQVYETVRAAQRAALAAAKAEMIAGDLDAAARGIIEAAGYGDYFGHATGHGVGLQIHEYPGIRASSKDLLPAGAVVTIEPGIYLPGKFGVRIEDMVVLREGGCENLSTLPTELLIL